MKNIKGLKYLLLDLDGVIYGSHNGYPLEKVFGMVSARMTKYIQKKLNFDEKKAKELQTNYFYKYNTSLTGLILNHGVIGEDFLSYVHNVDISFMKEDKVLRDALIKLDMEKFIFTNGSAEHAKNILHHLGILDLFGEDKIFDIKDGRYIPKPRPENFDLMVKKFGINPKETIYIEDISYNLSIGYERGCTTVWLKNDEHFGKKDSDKEYVMHKIENLSLFLGEIRLLKSK